MSAGTNPTNHADRAFGGDLAASQAAGDRLRRARGLAPRAAVASAAIEERLRAPDASDDELSRLAAAARGGDAGARGRLVESALPWIARVARRYAGPDVDAADLVQEGVVGVLRAIARYDPDRGVPFRAYAGWWVRQAMQQAVAEQSRSVRLPAHVLWDLHDVKTARERLAAGAAGEPTTMALRAALGWSETRLGDVLRAERPAVSLDAPAAGDERSVTSLGELLEQPVSGEEYEDVVNRATAPAVRALLATLTARERQVIAWRYGLEGEDELSLRGVARRLGISAEGARQLEARALAKLRAGALPAAERVGG
jgi:RNA polymerase primary sigma factor